MSALEARVEVRLGDLDLAVDLALDDGEVVALLGPNGAGKTTVLRALAGLRPVDGGRISLDGTVLDDPATDTWVAPADRPIGVVFQEHRLFPHLRVADNVAFGLRARGVPKAAAEAEARRWLATVGLAHRADAAPATLSGGEAQRVALARAVAYEPRLLLLDEPLAALDASTRDALRRDLRQHLAAVPGVRLLVTHDPIDAAVLADRLVVVEGGRVTQVGTVAEVTARPASRYVADLVGVNALTGTARGASVRLDGGLELVLADPVEGPVTVAVRPQAVALHDGRPDGTSARNAWPAVVAEVRDEGTRARVLLRGPVTVAAEVTPASVAALGLTPGASVWASVKAVDLVAHPR